MKLKYKKIIIIVSMSTMGIGLVTLSIGKPNINKTVQSARTMQLEDVTAISNNVDSNVSKKVADSAQTNTDADIILNEDLTNEISKKLEEVSVNNILKRDAYEDVNHLVENYLAAIAKCDTETLDKLVSDSSFIDVNDLQQQSEYIEEYRNIECYTKEGLEEGSYIVYVYEELKLLGIDTLAPGMIRLYVATGEDGKPYIVSGTIDDKTNDFIQETSKDEDVVKLFSSVNDKFDVAVAADAELREFLEKIQKGIQEAEETISEAKKSK